MQDSPPLDRDPPREGCEVRIRGIVQGVGFRPFLYRLASDLGLAGTLRNDGEGVLARLEGPPTALRDFLERLPLEAPPLSRIESMEVRWTGASGLLDLRIEESGVSGQPVALVPADVATCEACLREMADPQDRRYRHPFINCTDCGPRYTLIREMPYDRPRTAMASFPMCPECATEYQDPTSRRFHAEVVACPRCGPRLWWRDGAEEAPSFEDPLGEACRRLREGAIVAIRGIGGWHLACDARNESAVGLLRRRKQRDRRPFAVMVPDLQAARRLAWIGPEEEALLRSRERPIVILERAPGSGLAASAAPGTRRIGLFLPYTPVHHLIFLESGLEALVMTSANPHDEPICRDEEEALERLRGIADGFLGHDRPIVTRCDDSVAFVDGGQVRVTRRSRGLVPLPLRLPVSGDPVLAVGGDLKNAFVVTRDDLAFFGPHVGDLEKEATAAWMLEAADHLCRLLAVRPRAVAHDLHPDYHATRLARILRDRLAPEAPLVPVQHHHAHALACLAEHGRIGPALALTVDGTGLGPDGTIWGGEVLGVEGARFRRLGHLRSLALPGGDRAARDPWRCAAAFLAATDLPIPIPEVLPTIPEDRVRAQAILATSGRDVPRTSALGRLYDAMAAIAGLRLQDCEEGEAAVAVEEAAQGVTAPEQVDVALGRDREGLPEADLAGVLGRLAVRIQRGQRTPEEACAIFQEAVIAALGALVREAAWQTGIREVALCGGAMQNRFLLRHLSEGLATAGLRVLVPAQVPMGDGGLALGQALASLLVP
ncbi:MAG TPA: carbamoyltransferase HypF [Myxococcota bacterium]|nr:carbamoyltransferase HypF [Myxococcota bacterium]HQK50585.1 carbamoyltransferase HypF [Myxococcota bacterium]